LCYLEPPSKPLEQNYFPFKLERIFIIENFRLSVRVTDFAVDEQTGSLSKVDVVFELKNRIKKSKSIKKGS
jgi:hypothetical protein